MYEKGLKNYLSSPKVGEEKVLAWQRERNEGRF